VIVDASAILAVYLKEDDAEHFARLMLNAETLYMSAPCYVELCLAAASKRGAEAVDDIDAQLALWGVEIIAFDQHAAKLAVSAFLRYGKGRGHPAQLNFGDCLAYAASKSEAMPLLFKGEDFVHTDVERAL
jgi:ribonuclease VapC